MKQFVLFLVVLLSLLFTVPLMAFSSAFLFFLDCFLNFINTNKYDVVLEGNFNVNILADDPSARNFLLVISASGCVSAIAKLTRIIPTTQSLIDLFITNFDSDRFLSLVTSHEISDHLPILFAVKAIVNEWIKSLLNTVAVVRAPAR